MSLLCLISLMVYQGCSVNLFDSPRQDLVLLEHWKIRPGDDPNWALPGDFDASWQTVESYLESEAPQTGVWWLRTRIDLASDATRLYSLCPEGLASAVELYWDGQRIYRNGVIGHDRESETIGALYRPSHIPTHLMSQGEHTLAVRVSNFHSSRFWHRSKFLFGDYELLLKEIGIYQVKVYFLVGILFVTLLLNVLLFFGSARQPRFLLFCLLCFFVGARLLVEYLWVFDTLTINYYDVQNTLVPVSIVAMGISFTLFLFYYFAMALTDVLGSILLAAGAALAMGTQTTLAPLMVQFLVVFTAWTLLRALFKHHEDGISFLIGLSLGALFLFTGFFSVIDHLTNLSMCLIFGFNVSLARGFARQEQRARAAELRLARLENQLLKRQIKPHFLMNTLTSIIAWMRRDPEAATQLVEALADEFRLVSEIADHPWITMEQELELCRLHLQVMSLRKGVAFAFETRGMEPDDRIPPMIFHTLIENGLTHGFENRWDGRFVFTRSLQGDRLCYRLFNNGSGSPGAPGTGTGMKYVRSRLNECYGDDWELEAGAVDGGWQVVLKVPAPKPEAGGEILLQTAEV